LRFNFCFRRRGRRRLDLAHPSQALDGDRVGGHSKMPELAGVDDPATDKLYRI
jgi:hypothetical protein